MAIKFKQVATESEVSEDDDYLVEAFGFSPDYWWFENDNSEIPIGTKVIIKVPSNVGLHFYLAEVPAVIKDGFAYVTEEDSIEYLA